MCSLATIKQAKINRTTPKIMLDMEQARKEGFQRLEFTGGEPAIRKDIFKLISHARKLGFKDIGIGTNGNMFYYPDLCRRFVDSGLNKICLSLHGHSSKLHNSITRTPGSFEKTISGIKNIVSYPGVMIEAATVATRLNYRYLEDISALLFNELGIKRWSILDLIPEGNAESLYPALSTRLTNLSRVFTKLLKILPKTMLVNFTDFPRCIFPPSAKKSANISFVTAKERDDTGELRGYGAFRIIKIKNSYMDKYKIRSDICNDCRWNKTCAGIWKRYKELYGTDELNAFVKNRRT